MIGGNESAQCVGIEAAISVRDQRERDCIDSRIVFQLTVGEFGQFVIVTLGRSSRISRSCSSTMWKLSTSHSAAGEMARPSRMLQRGSDKQLRVCGRCLPAEATVARDLFLDRLVFRGENFRVLFQTLDAENFCANGCSSS